MSFLQKKKKKEKKKEIVFVRNLNPYRLLFQLLIVCFGYRWLQHFEPQRVALVKLGTKRVYVSVSVKDSCTRFYGGRKLWMSKLSSELRLTVTCHMCIVNNEFAVARPDMYPYWCSSLIAIISERPCVFQGSKWSGTQAQNKRGKTERRRRKKKKKEKETSYNIKDHKNDCLTDALTRLKLVMKNK